MAWGRGGLGKGSSMAFIFITAFSLLSSRSVFIRDLLLFFVVVIPEELAARRVRGSVVIKLAVILNWRPAGCGAQDYENCC